MGKLLKISNLPESDVGSTTVTFFCKFHIKLIISSMPFMGSIISYTIPQFSTIIQTFKELAIFIHFQHTEDYILAIFSRYM